MNLRHRRLNFVFVVTSCSIFLAGVFGAWVSTAINYSLADRIKVRVKSHQSPGFSEEDIDRIKTRSDYLISLLEHIESKSPSFLEPGKHLDAITLSGQVHKLVNELRNSYKDAGIRVADRNFGFSGYIQNIGFSSEEDQTQSLAHQLYLVNLLSRTLLDSTPISLDSLVLEEASSSGIDNVENQFSCRMTWSGYTDSFRCFLNRIQQERLPIRYASIRVERSDVSEVDLVETFLSDHVDFEGKGGLQGSPFPPFAELEVQDGAKDEMMPLIGETISRFTVVVELISS